MSEREREREREGETETETDRQTDRQTHRQTDTQTHRHTDTQREHNINMLYNSAIIIHADNYCGTYQLRILFKRGKAQDYNVKYETREDATQQQAKKKRERE